MNVEIIYEVGDVVRLVSGGPAMTVIAINADGVKCIWFSVEHQGKIEGPNTGVFAFETIRPVQLASHIL
jgi:uncharacterized protein YodC (DUF2158 family)